MSDFLKAVAAERVAGKRPSPARAAMVAIAAGAAAAGFTYRVLRR